MRSKQTTADELYFATLKLTSMAETASEKKIIIKYSYERNQQNATILMFTNIKL